MGVLNEKRCKKLKNGDNIDIVLSKPLTKSICIM